MSERQRRNECAGGMTPAQKRRAVLIADDVLKWMRTKRIKVETDTYFRFDEIHENLDGQSLQEHLTTLVTRRKPCAVCALGACFIASVDRFNQVKVDSELFGLFNPQMKFALVSDHLSETFSTRQRDLIEAAFEQQSVLGFVGIRTPNAYERSAVRFGKRRTDSRARLRAIMRNIIANRGVFVPPAMEVAA